MRFSSFLKKGPECPIDLVMDEILTRLPAKSLMRFKCVPKFWSSHIESRYFSSRFLTVPSRPRPRLYLRLWDLYIQESVLLSLAPDTTTPSTFVVDHNMPIPPVESLATQTLGGFMSDIFFCKKSQIFNPATRQLVTLPAIIPPLGEGNKFVQYFFGHDPVNDQYKVLCITSVIKRLVENIRSEVWVCVLKHGGDSWRKVAITPYLCAHIPCPRTMLCMNGVIYYLACLDLYKNYVLGSFHIRSEEFRTIQIHCKDGDELPESLKNMSLVDYGGKLCLLDITNLRDKGMLDLWVSKDATNKEWSRKTSVLQPSQLHLVNKTTFNVKGTTQNGEVLLAPKNLMSPFYILCYDLQRNDMRKIEIKGIPDQWFIKDKRVVRFDLMFMDHSESITQLET